MLKTEIAKRLNLNPTRIHYYTERGLVIPDIANPTGRGTNRQYSEENLIEFKIIEHLKDCGQTLDAIALLMHHYRIGKEAKQEWWVDALSGTECREKAYSILRYKPGKKPRSNMWTMSPYPQHMEDQYGKKIGFREYLKLDDDDSLAIVVDMEAVARACAE